MDSTQPSSQPELSVVVAVVSDTLQERADTIHLAACLQSLSEQIDCPSMEVLVPFHDRIDGVEELKERFPQMRFMRVTGPGVCGRKGSREHHDVIRARGLAEARGEVVALIEDYGRASPHWCRAAVEACRGPYACAGGAMENGIDKALNWAVYFCDYGRYQNPLPEHDSAFASDANVSYRRAALESIRSVWERSFREVVVNGALVSRGERVTLARGMVVHQHRQDLGLLSALSERFVWGRSFAHTRNRLSSRGQQLTYAMVTPVLPLVLLLRNARTAWQRGTRFPQFLRASPIILLLLVSWCIGEGVGYLSGRTPQDHEPSPTGERDADIGSAAAGEDQRRNSSTAASRSLE